MSLCAGGLLYTCLMFNLFKSVRLRWFDIAVFKVGLLATGVAVGVYWADFFMQYMTELVGVALIALVYVLFIWLRQ